MESMVEGQHLEVVNAEAIQLVRDYMVDPGNHMLHPKRFSNSITNSISKQLGTAISIKCSLADVGIQSSEFALAMSMARI